METTSNQDKGDESADVEEYLNTHHCTKCLFNCKLSNPSCLRGKIQAREAKKLFSLDNSED